MPDSTLVWHTTASTKPNHKRVVIWMGLQGEQLTGIYDKNQGFILEGIPVNYTPSHWRYNE